MCSCIWLAPPRLAFFLAICGVGHPLSIIIWFNKVVEGEQVAETSESPVEKDAPPLKRKTAVIKIEGETV